MEKANGKGEEEAAASSCSVWGWVKQRGIQSWSNEKAQMTWQGQ